MLRKIDCVMIRVPQTEFEAASQYYTNVFGLRRLWQDENSVGLGFPETDAEIVLHTNPDIPSTVEVHYLVENVAAAVQALQPQGCRIVAEPFDIVIGQCAVIQDPFGTTLCLLDMSKGSRASTLALNPTP